MQEKIIRSSFLCCFVLSFSFSEYTALYFYVFHTFISALTSHERRCNRAVLWNIINERKELEIDLLQLQSEISEDLSFYTVPNSNWTTNPWGYACLNLSDIIFYIHIGFESQSRFQHRMSMFLKESVEATLSTAPCSVLKLLLPLCMSF